MSLLSLAPLTSTSFNLIVEDDVVAPSKFEVLSTSNDDDVISAIMSIRQSQNISTVSTHGRMTIRVFLEIYDRVFIVHPNILANEISGITKRVSALLKDVDLSTVTIYGSE